MRAPAQEGGALRGVPLRVLQQGVQDGGVPREAFREPPRGDHQEQRVLPRRVLRPTGVRPPRRLWRRHARRAQHALQRQADAAPPPPLSRRPRRVLSAAPLRRLQHAPPQVRLRPATRASARARRAAPRRADAMRRRHGTVWAAGSSDFTATTSSARRAWGGPRRWRACRTRSSRRRRRGGASAGRTRPRGGTSSGWCAALAPRRAPEPHAPCGGGG